MDFYTKLANKYGVSRQLMKALCLGWSYGMHALTVEEIEQLMDIYFDYRPEGA